MTYTLEIRRNKHDEVERINITDGDYDNPLGPTVIAKINPNLMTEAEFILCACNSHAELLEACKLAHIRLFNLLAAIAKTKEA